MSKEKHIDKIRMEGKDRTAGNEETPPAESTELREEIDVETRQTDNKEQRRDAEIEALRNRVQEIGADDKARHSMDLIGEGGESLVYDAQDGTVLKVGKPGYPVEFLRRNAELFERLKEHIGKFLPETEFIEALSGDDIPDELKGRPAMRQTKIEGKALHEITEEDLNNPKLLRNLIELMNGVLSFQEAEKEIIDFYGKARDWKRPANALDSANIRIQGDQPYLIDTGLVPSELQTEQGPVKITVWNAVAGIGWAIKERSVKKYFQHIGFAAKARYVQTVYRMTYATIFRSGIRSLEKKLAEIESE
ncbi:hypothetical protein KJ903_05620 [Patescibacteria group bacterium]|nr:hypothetical protein [Patescibacteria group bacterium]